jgi:3-vinyl bacteriochlorophyllide hydratase
MPRYTPEQLERRNASVWTKVQGILAPIQFVMFLVGVTVTYLYQAHIFL